MLPKKLRLTHEQKIKQAFRTRYRHFDQLIKIYMSHTQEPEFKLLVVVSKKIHKRAHERNRIRRKVHSIFEELYYNRRLPPRTTCVIQIADKRIIHMTREELKGHVVPLVSKVFVKML